MADKETMSRMLAAAGAEDIDDADGVLVIDPDEFGSGPVMMTHSGVEKSRVAIPLLLELELEKFLTVVRRISALPDGARIKIVEVSPTMMPSTAIKKYGDTLVAYVKRRNSHKGDVLGITVTEKVKSSVQLLLIETS